MRRNISILITLWGLLILSLGLFWIYESKTFLGRAESISGSFSPSDSICFYSPLQAKINDEKILLSCFFIKDNGKPAQGISSNINGPDGLNIEKIQPISDGQGQIKAYISSKIAGDFIITVIGNGIELSQRLTLRFTN